MSVLKTQVFILQTAELGLGLVVFEPNTFAGGVDGHASLTGPVNWIEIPRDKLGFLAFLQQVLDVLELPDPPESSPTCGWCQYRAKSRTLGI